MNIRIVCSALLMTGLTFSCAAQNQEATDRNAASSSAISATYQRWIDEDVVYIATQKERRKFLALKSQGERDRFIEQFWKAA